MALESNIIGLWAAKQASKGSPASMTAGTKRMRWVGGDIQTNRADGSENWSDGTLFGQIVDFVNTIVGNGAPVVQAQSGILAYLAWLAAGQETFTAAVNQVITLTETGTPTGGTFTLSWTLNGQVFTTAPIAFGATGAQVVTAIQTAIPQWSGASFVITPAGGPFPGTPITLTFSGTAGGGRPVPLPTVNSAGLTGGVTPAVAAANTTPGIGAKHVITPNDLGGFFSTWVKSVGKSTIHRSQYNDCRIQSLRLEGSSASKVLKGTPTFLSLDPGQILSVDPSKIDDGNDPFVYTEGVGAFTIDGSVYKGQSSFASLLTWGLQEYYGDDVVPQDLINVRATATLEGVTILLDAAGLTRYNQQIYGTPTPAANQKPLKYLPAIGSYSAQFNKTDRVTGLVSETALVEYPGVKWSPDLNIPANPDGGAVELPLAGEFRGVVGQPPWRITTTNNIDTAAFTA